MKVITHKVVDAQGYTNSLATSLHRSTAGSYESICRNVCGALVEVGKRLKVGGDRVASIQQQGDLEAVRAAAKYTHRPFVDASRAAKKSLGLIIWRASGTGESAWPDGTLQRTVNWDANGDASSGCAWSSDVSRSTSTPNSPSAYDLVIIEVWRLMSLWS